ncbi:MAG: DciA family protein [Pseudomonadota bacterium]|nr:DciA family protein [Pseudomonadota bacterium]
MPQVAKAAFEAHGFPSAELLTNWRDISGADLASFTRPERIVWPKRKSEPGGPDVRSERGATLVLRTEGPRALEVQFMAAQLLDRLNTYFGYGAITELRLLQAPIGRGNSAAQAKRPVPELPIRDIEGIEDEPLNQALGRLAAQIDADQKG